ncbi:MAG: Rrf2 family transcriptional regulator [Candidatus Aureabacteria bacterium]|nr:Rrf2 family transcriptional regulator [Candidatus Auribacterota bacterium]
MSHIIKISEACTIAFHVMVYLYAKKDNRVCSRDISDTFKISEAHLQKVIQRLGRAQMVITTRGPAGGIMLAKNGGRVTLMQIFEIMEGKLSDDPCLLGKSVCSGKNCFLQKISDDISKQIKEYLQETKISDLGSLCEELRRLSL